MLNFLISNAYAQTAATPAPAQGGGMSLLIMFVVLILFMYFGMWRPQSKRAKEQRDLLSSLAKGDEVATAGGMLGRISKVNEQYITLAVANNVDITMQKASVTQVLPKGTLKTIE